MAYHESLGVLLLLSVSLALGTQCARAVHTKVAEIVRSKLCTHRCIWRVAKEAGTTVVAEHSLAKGRQLVTLMSKFAKACCIFRGVLMEFLTLSLVVLSTCFAPDSSVLSGDGLRLKVEVDVKLKRERDAGVYRV